MSVDRYTKVVLTVIAVCLVWIAAGGPSLLTPVNAQSNNGQRVLLSGWVEASGTVVSFPDAPRVSNPNRSFGDPASKPIAAWPLPVDQ